VADNKRRTAWIGFEFAALLVAFGALALGLGGFRVSRAQVGDEPADR
jgi:hypothetical protein